MPQPHPILTALTLQNVFQFTRNEVVVGAIRLSIGIVVAFGVYRFVLRNPWPRPFRVRFALLQALAAIGFALVWHGIASALQGLAFGVSIPEAIADRLDEGVFIGVILYIIVAGISYAVEGTARAARAEATAAKTQLAALRAQLHPHFLFNALHTVVQLIPVEPARASDAAELLAGLLRTTIEEKRDEWTLADEWSFVSRYLEIERIRFGDRLAVRADIPDNLRGERVPAFAIQTLIENAIRHGAAPRVAATEISVTAEGSSSELKVSVKNSSGQGSVRPTEPGAGTGLPRLRERLSVLYGAAARLDTRPVGDNGFEAVLVVPRHRDRQA